MPEIKATTVKRLREIFELLVRTMKTLTLYEVRNTVSENLEAQLYLRLAELLDDVGPLELRVLHEQILFGEHVVYENQQRKESLAFLLSRDGIHGLVFQPGLAAEELARFISCLNRARSLVGDEDDLATLLWEEGLESIAYHVIDELADATTHEEDREPLVSSSGWVGGSSGAEASRASQGAGGVALEDVKPSARLPVGAARLSAADMASLQAELADENAFDLPSMVVDLAAELVMLEPDDTERRKLAISLQRTLNQLLVEGRPTEFLQAVERLDSLADRVFEDADAVRELGQGVRQAAADRPQLSRFLDAVAEEVVLVAGVERFLVGLSDSAVPTLVSYLGRMRQPRLRRIATEAILVHGVLGPKLIIDGLQAPGSSLDGAVIEELFYMLRHLPRGEASAMVERLLKLGNTELTRRGTLILGQIGGPTVERMLLDLLDSSDPQTSSLAISALARGGNPSIAPRLLRKALDLASRGLDEEEVRRQLRAIGRLGGDLVLPAFVEALVEKSRGWLPSRQRRPLVRALVHGVRAVESSASHSCLEELAVGRNRLLRSICREELPRS